VDADVIMEVRAMHDTRRQTIHRRASFGRPGHQAGNFTHGHTLAVDSKGSVYVAETDWGRRIQKFKIEP
jgi:hypothetical protein